MFGQQVWLIGISSETTHEFQMWKKLDFRFRPIIQSTNDLHVVSDKNSTNNLCNNTTWKYGILKDLHNAGLRGRLPLFISGCLSDRKFQVRVGGTYSKVCEQEMGVPQGSILSATLFCLKINSIVKALCLSWRWLFFICWRFSYLLSF